MQLFFKTNLGTHMYNSWLYTTDSVFWYNDKTKVQLYYALTKQLLQLSFTQLFSRNKFYLFN